MIYGVINGEFVMKILMANESDAKEISEMIESAIRYSFESYYPECSIDYLINLLNEENLKNKIKNLHFYIARENDEIVGCGAIGVRDKNDAEIFNVFVSPNLQRKGVGRKIIEILEKDEYFCNAKRIEVSSSLVGVPFYKKMGYVHKNGELIYDDGCLKMEKFNKS